MCGIQVVFHFHNSDSISDHVDTLAKQYDTVEIHYHLQTE